MDGPLAACLAAAAATLVAAGGVALLIRLARRGRRLDDHPTCRRCRFDLTGLPATSDRCPECGADLRARRAIVIGNRAPRLRLLVASVVAASVLLAIGAAITVRLGRAVDWQGNKPT